MVSRKAGGTVTALAFLLLGWPAISVPDGLGKLLTTPEERQLIAARRHPAEAPAEEPKGGELLRFEGVARDEEGTLDVWINGEALGGPSRLRQFGMSLVQGGDGVVRLVLLTPDHGFVRLAPGQAYDRATGRVLEPWEQEEPPVKEESREETAGPNPEGEEEAEGEAVVYGPDGTPVDEPKDE
ncbi:MAG TPA: hypothetical protein ENJ98_06480 [Thiolapillus brandeum]|uniref:Uncharacterized protein n=1 Tax=Thiolapillus brandeum TaxID=1076588 RepID=A0A7C5NAR4_9GAMM|nr:hypothetical protein [Thiolapillus brandeum]